MGARKLNRMFHKHMQDHKYIWVNSSSVECVVVPAVRMIATQSRTGLRFYRMNVDHVHLYLEWVTDDSLRLWWTRVMLYNATRTWAYSNGDDRVMHNELMNACGPVTVNKIYRYNANGIYVSETLDAHEQRRLLEFTHVGLVDDVCWRICVTAFLILCDESVMRVIKLE